MISDFHLAKLENGLIKDPCGTPEYLGENIKVYQVASEAMFYRRMWCGSTAVTFREFLNRVSSPSAAPEVVGRQRYGQPVDCWATGVIMYIL